MSNQRRQIGSFRMNFAKNIVNKYATFDVFRYLTNYRDNVLRYRSRLDLAYALPFMLLTKNMLISKKDRSPHGTEKNRVQGKAYFEKKISYSLYLSRIIKTPLMILGWNNKILEKSRPFTGQILKYVQAPQLSNRTRTIGPSFLGELSPHTNIVKYEFSRVKNANPPSSLNGEAAFHLPFTIRGRHSKTEKAYPFNLLSSRVTPLARTDINKSNSVGYEYAPSEHVIRAYPQIIRETREKIVEKEGGTMQKVKPPSFDLNRLTEQLIQLIERKVRIERERRGL